MVDYQKLYAVLFNAVTDAIEQLEQFQPGNARTILVRAQQKTEELYISFTGEDLP